MYGRDQNEADAGGRPEQKPLDRGATDGGARSSSSATRGFGIRRRTSTHEPFDGPLDAALQRDLRRPVQHPADLFDVHDTPTDVVHVAPVDVLHRKWPKGHPSDRGGQGVHRGLDARADVEHLALGPRMADRKEGCIDRVLDEGEVPRAVRRISHVPPPNGQLSSRRLTGAFTTAFGYARIVGARLLPPAEADALREHLRGVRGGRRSR